MTTDHLAGIVYNETSSLRPFKGKEDVLTDAREKLAEVVLNVGGKKVAPAHVPSAASLKNPLVKEIWEDCRAAAETAKQKVSGDCDHFFIWPSGDGKTPDESAGHNHQGIDQWPFSEKGKIVKAFGPFRNVGGGDCPAGPNIYVFIYSGIK